MMKIINDLVGKTWISRPPEHTRKLTQLLSTHGQFMTFSTYYLWFLVDRCHFVIEDVKSIIWFNRHRAFNGFVKNIMNKRIEYMKEKNNGGELFCKINLNGSYGYDIKNTENYNKVRICNREEALNAHCKSNFMDDCEIVNDRDLSNNHYIVSFRTQSYECNTFPFKIFL